MKSHSYNKRSTPNASSVRSKIAKQRAAAARDAAYAARRIPAYLQGYAQMGGAYRRSFSGETKYIDSSFTNAAIATAGTIVSFTNTDPGAPAAGASMCLIPQGTTKNSREANKCLVYGLRIRGTISISASSNTTEIIRIIIYHDKQANGAAATVANILESANQNSFRAIDYVDRINVLHDKFINIGTQLGTGAASNSTVAYKAFKWSHKCSQEIRYSSTTGAIGEIQSNNFGMLLISQAALVNFVGIARTYFRDH